MLIVREETPCQEEVAELLQQSDAVAARLYPGAYRRPIDSAALDAPGIRVFVARQDSVAAGCCALFLREDGTAELKRMIVDERFRGHGVGTALLRTVEAVAVAVAGGIRSILMEVGIRNADGQVLYRRAGYRECGPFGTYQPSPISLFFEKSLA